MVTLNYSIEIDLWKIVQSSNALNLDIFYIISIDRENFSKCEVYELEKKILIKNT